MQLALATIMTTMMAARSSVENPIEQASRRNGRIFAAYIVILVVTALLIAIFTWLTWDSGIKLQEAIRRDADARIKEASKGVEQLRHDNIKLSGDLEKEKGKVAGLERDAANAKAAQQKVETELAKQQERAAVAERTLLQLRQSLKDRTISPAQHKILVEALRGAPSGSVDILWTASDSDSFRLASQMIEIFKEAGWPQAKEHFLAGGTGNGIFIFVHNREDAPAYAASIQNAYKLIGVDMIGHSDPKVPEGKVQIYIGHKPPTR